MNSLLKHTLCGSAVAAFIATPALAQIPSPTASFTGETVMTTPEGTYSARLYGVPGKMRTDAYIQGYSSVSVMDMNREEMMSWSPDPNSGMGTMAMKMNYGDIARKQGFSVEPGQAATLMGSDTVAGHRCTVYRQEDVTACVTYDGITMRVRAPEGYGTEMRTMTRGPQAASLFQIPAGYTVMDPTNLGSMASFGNSGGYETQESYESSNSTYENSGYSTQSSEDKLARGLSREADRKVDREVSDRAGGLLGDIAGDEAGKLVGGLFGKKKKKKKKKKRD